MHNDSATPTQNFRTAQIMFITQPPLLCQLISILNMIRPKKDNSCDKKQLSPGVTRNVNVPLHRNQGVGCGSDSDLETE